MVSQKTKADPLGGLLSNLNGIDSSLFEHKALKDIHKPENAQIAARSASNHSMASPDGSRARTDKAINRSPPAGPSRPSQAPSTSWSHSGTNMSSQAKGSQFDALLGDLSLTGSSRWVIGHLEAEL